MLERLECSVVQLSRVDTGTIRFDSEYYSKSNIKLEKIIAKKKGKTVGEHKGIVDCSAFYPSITGFYSDDRSLVPFLRVNEITPKFDYLIGSNVLDKNGVFHASEDMTESKLELVLERKR